MLGMGAQFAALLCRVYFGSVGAAYIRGRDSIPRALKCAPHLSVGRISVLSPSLPIDRVGRLIARIVRQKMSRNRLKSFSIRLLTLRDDKNVIGTVPPIFHN